MLKSKLDRFLAKRAAAVFVLLAGADMVFLANNRWLALAGLMAGAFCSIGRLGCHEWIYGKIVQAKAGKTVAAGFAAFTISQFVLLAALAVVCFANVWVLYGFIAGVLTVPAAVMVNSLTEALGITKNHFTLGE